MNNHGRKPEHVRLLETNDLVVCLQTIDWTSALKRACMLVTT